MSFLDSADNFTIDLDRVAGNATVVAYRGVVASMEYAMNAYLRSRIHGGGQ